MYNFSDECVHFGRRDCSTSAAGGVQLERYIQINSFKRTILPIVDLQQIFVGYSINQPLRNFGSVDWLQRTLNVTLRHTFGVHLHDFLFDFVGSCLSLFKDYWLKFAVSVAGNSNLTLSIIADYCLFTVAIPVVWQSAIISFSSFISLSPNPCVLFMCNTSLSCGYYCINTVRYSTSILQNPDTQTCCHCGFVFLVVFFDLSKCSSQCLPFFLRIKRDS